MSKFKKIGPKMLLSLLTTFIVVLGAFLILVIVRTTALANNMADELVLNAAQNHANAMSTEFNMADELLLGLKFAADQVETLAPENRRKFLDNMLENAVASDMTVVLAAWACFEPNALDGMDDQYKNTGTSDATGRYISYFNTSSSGIQRGHLTDYDVPGAGDYYLVARDTGKPYVVPPYDYEVNGSVTKIISFAYPIINSAGKIVGVVGVDYDLDYMNTINDAVKLYDSGFGKLLTDTGVTVAHKDRTLLYTADTDLANPTVGTDITSALKAGNPYINKIYSAVLSSNAFKAFVPVPLGNSGINWTYSVVIPEKEVMAETNQMVTLVVIIGFVGLLAAAFIIVMLSTSISNPIKAMCEVASKIAGGELSVNVDKKYQKRQDEIGDLSKDLQIMRDGLVETVSGINNATGSLQGQVATINNALGVLNDRISDTSAATEELSASMEETGASAEEMNATASEIEHAVETVSEKAEEGATKSSEIHARASELGKSVNDSIDKSNNIFNEIKVALEKALEDSKAVDEINALADAILGITSQTTLLALNASIEAARAGEAGKGFAVVANEISALADNSKNTVTQIQAITKVVMSAVNALAKSSTDLLTFVAEDVQADYKDMLVAAESYNNDAIYVSDMTSDLSATSEELLASVQVMLRAINEVSMAAQEGARTTTVVAEQTSDISANASTVVNNMVETQHTSEELVSLVSKFKL